MSKKVLLSLILVVCLLISGTAQAETYSVQASECIRSYIVTITAQGGGVIEAAATVGCNHKASKIVITLKIQEKRSSGWVTVATAPNGTKNDAYSHGTSTTYNGTVGTEYRATLSIAVTYNGVEETRSVTSEIKTAKN